MSSALELIDSLLPTITSQKNNIKPVLHWDDDTKEENKNSSLYQLKNDIENMDANRLKHKLLCYIYAQLLKDKTAENKVISNMLYSSDSFSNLKRKHFSAAFDLQHIVSNNFNINLDINICIICAEYSYSFSLEGKWDTTFGLMDIKNGKGYYSLSPKIPTSHKTVKVISYGGHIVKGEWGRTNSSDEGLFEFKFDSFNSFKGTWWRENTINFSPGKWNGKRIDDDKYISV
eukprot:205800_1